MAFLDTLDPYSTYSIGTHFLFFLLITAHVCLIVDMLPIQKHPVSQLNFVVASVMAAMISLVVEGLGEYLGSPLQLDIGLAIAFIASVFITLRIQRVFDNNIEF